MFFDRIINKFHIGSTQTKIITNVFWAITGKVVTLLSTLIVGIFVARYLGPDQYGLMNYDELTQKDVAKMMGISQSYISRLEKKIIKKLRNKLNYNEIK